MKEIDLDRIVDFLSGRLKKEDQEAMKKELDHSPLSAEDASVHQAMLNYVDQSGDLETKEWVKSVLPKYQAKSSQVKRSILVWLIPVAAVAAMLLLFFLPATFQKELSANQLLAQHLEPYEMSFGDRGQEEDVLLKAGQAYQTQNYTAAIPLLNQAIEKSKDGKYQLALGISLLQTGKSSEAIKNFQALIAKADPVYTEHAQWYAALAHLQQEDIASAAKRLEVLADNPKAFNHAKAKAMLSQKIFF